MPPMPPIDDDDPPPRRRVSMDEVEAIHAAEGLPHPTVPVTPLSTSTSASSGFGAPITPPAANSGFGAPITPPAANSGFGAIPSTDPNATMAAMSAAAASQSTIYGMAGNGNAAAAAVMAQSTAAQAQAQASVGLAQTSLDKELLDDQLKKEDEHWVKAYWRPAMGWLYMLICFMDFIGFPLISMFLPILFRKDGINAGYVAWQSLTLSNGGLIHLAFGAILGVAAFTRGSEKVALINKS